MAKQSKHRHVTLSMPRDDERCMEWLDSQRGVSASIRLLIQDAISRWGMKDIVWDVMPAAMAAVSGGRAARQRFSENLQQAERQEPVPQQATEPVTEPVQEKEVPKEIPKPPAPQAEPPVDDPDDDDYFVDPSQFLN